MMTLASISNFSTHKTNRQKATGTTHSHGVTMALLVLLRDCASISLQISFLVSKMEHRDTLLWMQMDALSDLCDSSVCELQTLHPFGIESCMVFNPSYSSQLGEILCLVHRCNCVNMYPCFNFIHCVLQTSLTNCMPTFSTSCAVLKRQSSFSTTRIVHQSYLIICYNI